MPLSRRAWSLANFKSSNVEVVQVESAEELEQALSDKFAPCEYAGTRPSFRRGQVAGQDLGGGIALVAANFIPVETSSRARFRFHETPEDVLFFGIHFIGTGEARHTGASLKCLPAQGSFMRGAAREGSNWIFTPDCGLWRWLFPVT